MPQEERLVERARAGEADAWSALYRAHAGRLLAWLAYQAPRESTSSAEDLCAATWLTAAEGIGRFRGGDAEFPGWLFGIARNHARNATRALARRGTGPVADTVLDARMADVAPVPGVDSQVVSDVWVREALAALPPREREVLTCTDVVGLDVASTAAALGISAVAVRVSRHRGLSRLRRLAQP